MAGAADIAEGFNGGAIHVRVRLDKGLGAKGGCGLVGTLEGGTEAGGIHFGRGGWERLRCLRRGRGRRGGWRANGGQRLSWWFREDRLGFVKGRLEELVPGTAWLGGIEFQGPTLRLFQLIQDRNETHESKYNEKGEEDFALQCVDCGLVISVDAQSGFKMLRLLFSSTR